MIERKRYSIFYADPPWDYRGRLQHGKRKSSDGAACHYRTSTPEEIARLDIPHITAEDALCFMWVCSPLLPEAMYVMQEWGFKYATIAFVWHKKAIIPGYYTLSSCELVIVGKVGKIPLPRGTRNERQFISEMRGEHSEKPIEIRKRIDRMFPYQKKLELFSRSLVYGWDVFGDETSRFDNAIEIPRRSIIRPFER